MDNRDAIAQTMMQQGQMPNWGRHPGYGGTGGGTNPFISNTPSTAPTMNPNNPFISNTPSTAPTMNPNNPFVSNTPSSGDPTMNPNDQFISNTPTMNPNDQFISNTPTMNPNNGTQFVYQQYTSSIATHARRWHRRGYGDAKRSHAKFYL